MKSHDALKNSYEKLLWYKNSNAVLTFTVSPDVVTSTSLQTTHLQHHPTILARQTFLYNFNKFQLNKHSLQIYCLPILNFVLTSITYHDWSLPLVCLPPPQSMPSSHHSPYLTAVKYQSFTTKYLFVNCIITDCLIYLHIYRVTIYWNTWFERKYFFLNHLAAFTFVITEA